MPEMTVDESVFRRHRIIFIYFCNCIRMDIHYLYSWNWISGNMVRPSQTKHHRRWYGYKTKYPQSRFLNDLTCPMAWEKLHNAYLRRICTMTIQLVQSHTEVVSCNKQQSTIKEHLVVLVSVLLILLLTVLCKTMRNGRFWTYRKWSGLSLSYMMFVCLYTKVIWLTDCYYELRTTEDEDLWKLNKALTDHLKHNIFFYS